MDFQKLRELNSWIEVPKDSDFTVQFRAVHSLGQLGQSLISVATVQVATALMMALGASDSTVRQAAASSLGGLEIQDETLLRRVLIALNRRLHDGNDDVRRAALTAIRRLLDGRQIPGYRWVPIREQQRRARIRKRIGWTVLGLGLVMLVLWLGGIANGQLDSVAAWVWGVVRRLVVMIFLTAGFDLLFSYCRRPPWDQ